MCVIKDDFNEVSKRLQQPVMEVLAHLFHNIYQFCESRFPSALCHCWLGNRKDVVDKFQSSTFCRTWPILVLTL